MFFRKKKLRLQTHQFSFFDSSQPPQSARGAKLKAFFRQRGIFLLVFILAWAALQSARLGALALRVKEKIVISAGGGVGLMQSAQNLLAAQDLNTASEQLTLATENFKASQDQLRQLEKDLLGLGELLPQKRDAEKLLSAAIDLTESAQSGIKFLKFYGQMSFGAQGLVRGEAGFDDLALELERMEIKLDSASKKIRQVNFNRLSEEQKIPLTQNLSKLDFALSSARTLRQLVSLGQTFMNGRNRILLLFQNQNELRPTGGFTGSFGLFALSAGRIEQLQISSIYDLDGQLEEKILPPEPVFAVNQRWFLRDANWFASFPESAKKIIAFYEKTGGETPDLVIAVTPEAVSDLLSVTGALKGPQGIELDQDSFTEQLQLLTQSSQSEPTNEPKKILGQLFTSLFQKIGELKAPDQARVLEIITENLAGKQLLLYSTRRQAQGIFEQFNWAGQVKESDRDYLMINSANLGGTKTDLFIDQKITLESRIAENGEIENTLTLIRTNRFPPLENSQNKIFLRIFVPPGSVFKEAGGFDTQVLEKPGDLQNFKVDPDVFAWEKSSVKDLVSGTLIGREAGKTFFGNWIILKGGETRTVTVKYTLPFKLKNLDRHSLLVQKQPGSPDDDFRYLLDAPARRAEWTNLKDVAPAGPFPVRQPLNKDLFFGMVLKRMDRK